MQNLGTLGGTFSYASSINDGGQVVGASGITGNNAAEHAFLYSAGHMQDLGTLGGIDSYASGINDWGQVVGASYSLQESFNHAFLYSAGRMQDLGTLGGSSSIAISINDWGQIVGQSSLVVTVFEAPLYAFLYSGGQMVNLDSLIPPNSGWTLTDATSINDIGQIVGLGTLNGQDRAFRLTPVR